MEKFKTLDEMVLTPSIGEELVHSLLVQELLLKRGVHKIASCFSPSSAKLVDHKVYTCFRVLIGGIAFGATHLTNAVFLTNDEDRAYVLVRPVGAIALGVFYGALYGQKGLSAVIGAHSMNNFIATLPLFLQKGCSE